MRHSYATYRLAATADAARVALEMGNSPQKLMRHYRELADKREAAAWFSISPKPRSKDQSLVEPGTSRSKTLDIAQFWYGFLVRVDTGLC